MIDGDTLEIHGERIRILDIDAPESRQTCWRLEEPGNIDRYQVEWRCGQQAALALSDGLEARAVTCETDKKDRYKRWLARCSVEGVDVALWLAEVGWVFPYRDCKCAMIRAAVDRAKAQHLGIWSGSALEPLVWRRAN